MRLRRVLMAIGVVYAVVWGIETAGTHVMTGAALNQMRIDQPTLNYTPQRPVFRPSRFGSNVAQITTPTEEINGVTISAPVYSPNKVRIDLTGPLRFVTALGQPVEVTNDRLSVEGRVRLLPPFEATLLRVRAKQVDVSEPALSVTSATLDVTSSHGTPRYPTALDISGVSLPPEAMAQIDPSGLFPPMIDRITFDGTIDFTGPIVLSSDTMPDWHGAEFAPLYLVWGDLDATVSGRISAMPDGTPNGQLDLSVGGWELLIQLLAANGAIEPETVAGYTAMGAGLAGEDGRVDLPLIFADGQIRLGPFPLGPAPVMFRPLL